MYATGIKKYLPLIIIAVVILVIILVMNPQLLLQKWMSGKIVFDVRDTHIEQALTAEETARLAEILRSGDMGLLLGYPACGFSSDVAIYIGPFRFCPAMDTCNRLLYGVGLQEVNVTNEEMDEIHAIFEKYGGYFPCI